MDLTELGAAGIFIILVFKEVFGFVSKQQQKKNGKLSGDEILESIRDDNKEILSEIKRDNLEIKGILVTHVAKQEGMFSGLSETMKDIRVLIRDRL
jgi:RecJ-like exonuclease